jgi:hypothetical protein
VEIEVDGGAPIEASSNGNGIYTASFEPPRLGEDIPIVIRLDGQPIGGSPYLIDIGLF